MSRPLILVTNDDGVKAPGIRFLIEIAKHYGDIVVMAPNKAQSGMAHAITIDTPLRIKEIEISENYKEYSCNGTPVDCVKIAEHAILTRKPDLLLSGINHGSNASVNTIYSGTMAAVFEGAMADIPAIGFSLLDYAFDANFKPSEKFIRNIIESVLKNSLSSGVCLNVNIPINGEIGPKGIKVCRQGRGLWKEEFEKRTDPRKIDYYWLKGYFEIIDNKEDTDLWALENNYISVVPVHFDFTAHDSISLIKNWKFDV
ncbi:5'/3'-nucleotidase SurE [Bacteroidota bacterium]